MIDLRISAMEAVDVAEVVQLDDENLSPWTTDHFNKQLHQPYNWHFVARSRTDHAMVGYICGQYLLGEAEIHKFAVAAACRRQRVGHRLLAHTLDFLHRHHARTVHLELRISNKPAQQLYESFAFRPCTLRKKYYTSPSEDAIIMKWEQQDPLP